MAKFCVMSRSNAKLKGTKYSKAGRGGERKKKKKREKKREGKTSGPSCEWLRCRFFSPARPSSSLNPQNLTTHLPSASPIYPPAGGGGDMEGGGEEFAIGVLISVKTTLGEEFEGQIVSFDRPTNLLVIHILSKSLPIRFSPPPPPISVLCHFRSPCCSCFLRLFLFPWRGRSQEGVGRAERGERRNVRVLKANYIREFSVVGKADDPLDPAGCVLDLAAIHAREEAALRCVTLPSRPCSTTVCSLSDVFLRLKLE